MTAHLVPVPPDALDGTQHLWRTYLLLISERDKCDPREKERQLYAGEVQAFFVWDSETNRPLAFLGVRYALRGDVRIGEIIWLMGEHRASWVHLFGDLQSYLHNQQGCKAIHAIARPGWEKHLRSIGFRLTHLTMEKELSDA
jgi:hypothetical protein